jgi:vacuolar-type H+-ATPase subunit E/Vma4
MTFRVMRADDNGNEVEIIRVEAREEAERIAHEFEARGHKQIYWIEPVVTDNPQRCGG